MKIGGVGLNLTSANVVILSEPWWNPAVDNQAIDRINRIGQLKPMKVFRLITQGTIEEHIRKISDEKLKIIDQTIEKCVDLEQ
jgi:SNF2 family DNA or RNA helicase